MQLTIAHPQEVVLASTIKRFLKTKKHGILSSSCLSNTEGKNVIFLKHKQSLLLSMWRLHLLRSRISVNTFQELLCQTRPTALRMACLQSTVLKSIMFYFQSANDFSFLLTYSFIALEKHYCTIILLVLLPSLTASTDAPISFVQVKHSTFSLP